MQVRLLGGVEVHDDNGGVVEITSAKTRWLLAFLALEPGRTRSADSIIDALWADAPPKTALNLVQGYVSGLRRLIGPDAIRTFAGGYQLVLDDADVDINGWRDVLGQAQAMAKADPGGAYTLVEDCLQQWVGLPFGESAPDGPLAIAATTIDGLRLDAEELSASCRLESGQHSEVVSQLEELVAANPYRERLWVMLSIALYRSGRQADALRRLHEARTVLQEELGISPGEELREVEQMILVHDVGLQPQPQPDPVTPSREPLVGRRSEIARLSDRVAQTRGGTQHTVFISGEPGIGKTALSSQVARRAAERGAVVLSGRCDEHVAVPYRPFLEAITDHLTSLDASVAVELIDPRSASVRAVLPLLGATLAPPDASTPAAVAELTLLERFDTVCWLLREIQQNRTLVIVLEDIHWADSATLRLLHYVTAGNRLPGSLTLATYRSTEPAELLDDILADLRTSPRAERMPLRGLEPADLRLLIDHNDTDGLVDWIYGQTDGNPFLSAEIMRHISETGSRSGLPDSVSEVVNQRLRRLSAPARRLAQHAAILGDSASIALLRSVAGGIADLSAALGELIERGILTEDDGAHGQYRFTHAILRTAAILSITSIDREDLHLAAARAWESATPSEESNFALASHYLAAGSVAPTEKATNAYIQAGHDADRAGAKVEAVEWYDRVLARIDPEDERHRTIRLTRFVAAQAAWHWHHGDHEDRRTGTVFR